MCWCKSCRFVCLILATQVFFSLSLGQESGSAGAPLTLTVDSGNDLISVTQHLNDEVKIIKAYQVSKLDLKFIIRAIRVEDTHDLALKHISRETILGCYG